MIYVDLLLALERARTAVGRIPRFVAAAGIVVGVALLFASSCNRASRLSAEVEQLRDAARLRAAGVTVADQVDGRELARQAARVPALEAELARVRAAAPDAKPTSLAHLTTGTVAAAGKARPADVRPQTQDGGSPEPASPAPPPTPPQVGGATVSCLLAAGDPAEITVDEVRLDVGAVVGVASAFRIDRTGPEVIITNRVTGTLRVAAPPAASAAPRWGAGPLVAALPGGSVAGALLSPPTLRLPWLGWQVDAVAGGAAGPGGWLVLGGAIVRP